MLRSRSVLLAALLLSIHVPASSGKEHPPPGGGYRVHEEPAPEAEKTRSRAGKSPGLQKTKSAAPRKRAEKKR